MKTAWKWNNKEQPPTKGPWEWRRMGKRWLLWGFHGIRPIVLAWSRGQLQVRDDTLSGGVMCDFDREHPDARLIAAAPDLLAAAKMAGDWLHDAGVCPPTILGKLFAAIEMAEGKPAAAERRGP